MREGTVSDDGRYWAFISYSHRDKAVATRLHRTVESYRIPAKLVGTVTPVGTVPRRLASSFPSGPTCTGSSWAMT